MCCLLAGVNWEIKHLFIIHRSATSRPIGTKQCIQHRHQQVCLSIDLLQPQMAFYIIRAESGPNVFWQFCSRNIQSTASKWKKMFGWERVKTTNLVKQPQFRRRSTMATPIRPSTFRIKFGFYKKKFKHILHHS